MGFFSQKQPYVAPDSQSNAKISIVYGLSEGQVAGLVNGANSIRIENTPLVDENGTNINAKWQFLDGTNEQGALDGFDENLSEIGVGVELVDSYTRNIRADAIDVRLNFGALFKIVENDTLPYRIEYAIDVKKGQWQTALNTHIEQKNQAGFLRTHRIDTKGATAIRVRRLTRKQNSDKIGDTITIEALTKVTFGKFRYPNTAVLGLKYDAKTFAKVGQLAVRLQGKIIAVPSNYNPITRTYTGLWNGQFKKAYSNNPAWVYYDIATSERYGANLDNIDKWALYALGQVCDEMVDDGKGGKEPRFTCNVYLQSADDAYKVLANLAGIFRALSYYDGNRLVLDGDTRKDAVMTFSRTNVVDGEFNYTGTRARDRHTVAKVAWDNPDDNFKTHYEWVRDEQMIARFGINVLEIGAFGCTSQAQAQRAGKWALLTEKLETRQVSFITGVIVPQVGQIINIADEILAGRALAGRVISMNGVHIELDRIAQGARLIIGKQVRNIVKIDGVRVQVDSPFTAKHDIWAMDSDDLRLMQFRVMNVAQKDETSYTITAMQYDPRKFDDSVNITPMPISVLDVAKLQAPNVAISQSARIEQGITISTLNIEWQAVDGASHYIVEYQKDDGAWQYQAVHGLSLAIDGVYTGVYRARVSAVDSFNNQSKFGTSKPLAVTGKTKPPSTPNFRVVGLLFALRIDWEFGANSDNADYTEVELSYDAGTTAYTLGKYAYPSSSTDMTGLQGGLTVHFRCRVVDKTGQASAWSAWKSATTENSANKLLTMLNGQISKNQLAQDLSTPIAKIDTTADKVAQIDTALNRAQLELANARQDFTTKLTSARQDVGNTISQARQEFTHNINQTRQSLQGELGTKVTELNRAIQSANSAQAQSTQALSAKIDNAKSLIDTVQSTIASNERTTAQRLDSLQSTLGNTDSRIERLQGTVSDNERAISTQVQKLNTQVNGVRIDTNQSKRFVNWENFNIGDIAQGDLLRVRLVGSFGADSAQIVNPTNGTAVLADLQKDGDDMVGELIWRYDFDKIGIKMLSPTGASNFTVYAYKAPKDSRIDTLQSTLTENERTTAQRLENIQSTFNQSKTIIETQLNTLSQADRATSERLQSLQATVADNKSRIDTQIEVLSTDNRNQTSRLDSLQSTVNSNKSAADSRIDSLQSTLTENERTTAQKLETISTKIDGVRVDSDQTKTFFGWENFDLGDVQQDDLLAVRLVGNIHSSVESVAVVNPLNGSDVLARFVDDGADKIAKFVWRWAFNKIGIRLFGATGASRLNVRIYKAHKDARIDSLRTAITDNEQASTQRIERLQSTVENNKSAVETQIQALTQADRASAQRIDSLQSTVNSNKSAADSRIDILASNNNATTRRIDALQSTLNGQTASVQTQGRAIDGLKAEYTIKVDAGGRVAGIGLASGAQSADFAVRADKFFVAGASGKGDSPFMVLTSPQYINGTRVPAGTYIKSAYIADGSIDNTKIKNASITHAEIANGAITSAKIGTAQVDTLQIAGGAVIVPRSRTIKRKIISGASDLDGVLLLPQGGQVWVQVGFDRMYSCTAYGEKKDDPVDVNLFIYNKNNELQRYSFQHTTSQYPRTVHKTGYKDGERKSWTDIEMVSHSYLDMKYICLPAIIDVSPPSTSEYYIRVSATGGSVCIENLTMTLMVLKR